MTPTLSPVNVYLDLSQYNLLKKVCKVTCLSMSRFMRSALVHYMRLQCQAMFGMSPREVEEVDEQQLKARWATYIKEDAMAAQAHTE